MYGLISQTKGRHVKVSMMATMGNPYHQPAFFALEDTHRFAVLKKT